MSKIKNPGLTRRASGLMALEQRFMFDGAAVDTAVDQVVDTRASDTPEAVGGEIFTFDATVSNLSSAAQMAQQQARDYLVRATDEQLFEVFNGGKNSPDSNWTQRLGSLREALENGSFSVNVVAMDNASQFTALAAFTELGPNGEPTIFINTFWFGMLDAPDTSRVLVEELGHAFDAYLNANSDTAGDEGKAFADRVIDGSLSQTQSSALLTQNDHGTVMVDGQTYEVEFASLNFTNAYHMVYDWDTQNNTEDTTERWASKEQNLHYFNTAGLGTVSISDGSNGTNFSGNDVSAVALTVGGQTYNGWISRPIKANGIVRGFYFWTDSRFSTLALAQADGNQDGDSSVANNRGFVLVVDQTWFNQQILDTDFTKTFTSSSKDVDDGYIANGSTLTIASVGSSSDRVDSALNSVIPATPTLSAANDASDLTTAVGASGGPALELGSDENDPTRSTYYATLNTDVSSGVLTATVNATGNVISNDTSATSVTRIESNSTKASTNVTSATSGVIQGLYGTLTINADGSYSYAINNENPTVNALLPSDAALSDIFTYTVTDGKSTTATATLTIRIKGSNDAPLAYHDTSIAKEITSTANTGYSASGNVITNDTDVDANDHLTLDLGLSDYSKTISVANITPTTPSSQLIFEGTLGANIGNGKNVGITISGTTYLLYKTNSGTAAADEVTVVGDPVNLGDSDGDRITEYAVSLSSQTLWYGTSGSRTQLTLSANQTFVFSTNSILSNSSTATTMSAEVVGKETVNATGLGLTSSNLFVGMEITGPAWPSGSYVSAITLSGSTVTSFEVTVSSNIDEVTYSSGVVTNFSLVYKNIVGKYGILNLNSDGSYTYTPYTDIRRIQVRGATKMNPVMGG